MEIFLLLRCEQLLSVIQFVETDYFDAVLQILFLSVELEFFLIQCNFCVFFLVLIYGNLLNYLQIDEVIYISYGLLNFISYGVRVQRIMFLNYSEIVLFGNFKFVINCEVFNLIFIIVYFY